jgi:hypothetical protein
MTVEFFCKPYVNKDLCQVMTVMTIESQLFLGETVLGDHRANGTDWAPPWRREKKVGDRHIVIPAKKMMQVSF